MRSKTSWVDFITNIPSDQTDCGLRSPIQILDWVPTLHPLCLRLPHGCAAKFRQEQHQVDPIVTVTECPGYPVKVNYLNKISIYKIHLEFSSCYFLSGHYSVWPSSTNFVLPSCLIISLELCYSIFCLSFSFGLKPYACTQGSPLQVWEGRKEVGLNFAQRSFKSC